ncbi:MAG: sterol desaturase family protein [Calditrichia bacterium]
MPDFSDLYSILRQYVKWFQYPATRWYFLLSCVALALIVYLWHYAKSRGYTAKGFLSYLFPKEIYTHDSTKLDLKYILSFPIIAGVFFKPALAFSTAAATYKGGYWLFENLFGIQEFVMPESWFIVAVLVAAFTIISAMAADLFFYFHHLLMHKVKFLWEFHKVHHSAEVLTPLVDYRAHPLEILTYGTAKGIGLGAAQAVFNYFTGGQIHIYTVLGLNAIIFVYYVMGYSLRHSHVWISYGPIFSKIFISPAQHQIHHSVARKHWDKNMGGAFALWDWMFGTLYVPKEKENLEFGIPPEHQKDFRSVRNLYLKPFTNNANSKTGLVVVVIMISVFLYFAVKQLVQFLL